MQVSVLAGMVKASGAGSFLQNSAESDDVVRVTLTFTSTSTCDQLSMDQLGPDNITYPEVFDDGTATHVVTGVEYGADVFFDFDKKVEKGSSNREIKGELQGAIETCKALLSVEGKMSAEIKEAESTHNKNTTVTFYGDIVPDKIPTTFSEAVEVMASVPGLVKAGKKPKKAYLYPLSKLDSNAAKLVRHISDTLLDQVAKVMQQYLNLQAEANTLRGEQDIVGDVPFLSEELELFENNLELALTMFKKELVGILPKIRGGGEAEETLAEMLQKWLGSSLSPENFKKCLGAVRDTLIFVRLYVKRAKKEGVNCSFQHSFREFVMENERVLTLCLNSACLRSNLLLEIKRNLQEESFEPSTNPDEWTDVAYAQKGVHELFSRFKEYRSNMSLMEGSRILGRNIENLHSLRLRSLKYILTLQEVEAEEGKSPSPALIRFYDYGAPEDIVLPSTPGKPEICYSVTEESMTVRFSMPVEGQELIVGYIWNHKVIYKGMDLGKRTYESDSEELVVTGVEQMRRHQPGRVYQYQVIAVSKAGLSGASEWSESIRP